MGFAALAGTGLAFVVVLNLAGTPANHSNDTVNDLALAAPEPKAVQEQPAIEGEAGSGAEESPNPILAEAPEKSLKLGRGETLIKLLRRAGFANSNAHAAVNELGKVTNLRRLQRGQEIYFRPSPENSRMISSLWIRDQFDERALVRQTASGYEAEREPVPTLSLTHLVEGTITDNLYLSSKRAGLPDKVIIDLIRMMSFNVDFEREIREGDTFQVYFERRYAPGFDDMEDGRILHVDLGLKRRPVNATLFETGDGESDYFDGLGKSTRRALMKTPLDVAVVTSSYGRRKHPVLGYTRMHKGVDFRAPTGTPIMAAGDGTIEMAARNGSFGNYIRIRHNDTYKTAYAHLSRYGKGIKKGKRVKQGQIIGYSGATGRVTAAHLHYEVHVSGKQANPLKLKLPSGKTLSGDNLARFQSLRHDIVADIERIRVRDQLMAEATERTLSSR